jgi:NADH-quinone oxidoreductase subunit J
VDTPALLPDGTPAESSVSRVLAARGTVRSAPARADDIDELTGSMGDGTSNAAVTRSGPRGPIDGDPSHGDGRDGGPRASDHHDSQNATNGRGNA